ncbi:MAG: heavy-metal-associated domain-containing protein, partial [Paracoccaceae bacterium]
MTQPVPQIMPQASPPPPSRVHPLALENMNCGSCAARVTRLLLDQPGITDVSVNLATDTAQITSEDDTALREALRALAERGYPARLAQVTLVVQGLSCASCVGRVDRALSEVAGVTDVSVNLATETAQVSYHSGAVSPANLIARATQAG